MELISRSLAETEALAQKFIGHLKVGPGGATVVGLTGDLGSGKTAFVQACARALGVTEKITSPTFVIMKAYDLAGKPWKRMIHIDAYRLKSGEELKGLKFGDLASDPDNIIFIEWQENVASVLPAGRFEFQFGFLDDNSRRIVYPDRT